MAIELFGIDSTDVRDLYFPNASFSAISKPTATAVGVYINEEAARLGAKLRAKDLDPEEIGDTTTSEAYAICAGVVAKAAAIRVMEVITAGRNEDLFARLRKEVAEFYDELSTDGATLLGSGVTAPEDEVDGPNTHIDANDLDTGDSADMSDVIPVFRRSDYL